MRSMRDTGVAGNVLVCDTIDSAELTALSRQNVFFFQRAQDRGSLAGLMEHQRQIAVWKTNLMAVFDLMNEYTLQKLFIVDPDPASITLALSHLDPDQVSIGGYCTETCGTYWKNQVDMAVYSK